MYWYGTVLGAHASGAPAAEEGARSAGGAAGPQRATCQQAAPIPGAR
jgi:hypothetical protein